MADDLQKVQVFGMWGSPFSRRVELALKLKCVDYEYIEEDVYKKKSDLLLKYNPVYKKVPVLVHGGKAIAESMVILEYIEETWEGGYPILPKHPYDKAQARFWAKFVEDKCMPALKKASGSQGEEQKKAIEEGLEALKTLENELENNKRLFFGGDNIGIVDIAANFIAFWFPILEEALGLKLITNERFPKLSKWSEDFVSNHVVKETLPPKDRLIAALQAHWATLSASK